MKSLRLEQSDTTNGNKIENETTKPLTIRYNEQKQTENETTKTRTIRCNKTENEPTKMRTIRYIEQQKKRK